MTTPFASVIIPAHNEAATIDACLRSVLDDPRREDLDVVVVCNGCTDDTVKLAQAHGEPVRVLETDIPSKANALEMGRKATADGPRLYIDADVILSSGAVSATVAVLERDDIFAAAPTVILDGEGATRPMQLFLDVWKQAPYFSDNLVGTGFYGVSAAGQDRLGSFPPIVADDMFVVTRFRSDERAVARDATFTPLMSKRLRDLVSIEVRREAARDEFAEWAASTGATVHDEGGLRWLGDVARQPRSWPGLALFVGAKLLIRAKAARRRRSDDPQAWTRDDHARQSTASDS